MSVSNNLNADDKRYSTEGLEMEEGVTTQDKRTRFQVNRVNNETTADKNMQDSILDISNDDTEDDDDDNDNLISDRTRLNSETDTKNFKSFR